MCRPLATPTEQPCPMCKVFRVPRHVSRCSSLPLLHRRPDAPTSSTPAATARLIPPSMSTISPMPKVCPYLSLPSTSLISPQSTGLTAAASARSAAFFQLPLVYTDRSSLPARTPAERPPTLAGLAVAGHLQHTANLPQFPWLPGMR